VHHGSDAREEIMDAHTNSYITGDPAFAVDRRGVIVLWNEAAEDKLGYPASEALGKKCWRLLSGKDIYGNRYCCRHCALREMAFRHEPVNSFQSTFQTASDQDDPFSVSCLAVTNGTGAEMLLHICRPDCIHVENSDGQTTTQPPPTRHLDTLSHRELEVLKLLAARYSTQKIADTLSISIRTVRTHIQHLMYKLRVHKRKEAIKLGKQLKLI